jgi:cytochrome P450
MANGNLVSIIKSGENAIPCVLRLLSARIFQRVAAEAMALRPGALRDHLLRLIAVSPRLEAQSIMTDTASASAVYYDPTDFAINEDPHPVWKRLRDEAPLYYNEEYGFYALSRYDDVESALTDWETYRSGRGTVFEMIRAGVEIPPGTILFEDPPVHDLHRALLTKAFTPRRINAIEPLIRQFCVRALDPLVGSGRLDFIADLGAKIPMRTIGYLLGIPEADQDAIRKNADDQLLLMDGERGEFDRNAFEQTHRMIAAYIDWRAGHPSDDLITELLSAEIEEPDGTRRRLTRSEVLNYMMVIAGAGNETTTHLIGFMGQLLSDHPGQRQQIVADRSLIPRTVEEALRYEAPSPVQCRYVAREVSCHGQVVPEGSIMVLLNGSANRDERYFPDPDRFDIHREARKHLSFGRGPHFCLGAALARLEGRVALDEVLNRWPEWQIDYGNAVRTRTSSVRGWTRLPATTR